MEIRRLTENDAAAWWNLRLEALTNDPQSFGKTPDEHMQTPVATIAQRFRLSHDGNFTLGAFTDAALVGMMTFIRNTGVKDGHKGNLYGVYVTPAQRGRGVANTLMKTLLEQVCQDISLEPVLLAVSTGQEPAKRLYRSHGFKTFGTEPNALKNGGTYVDEDHMILRIR